MFLPRRLENRSVTQPSLKSPFPVPSPCHTETFFPKPSMDPSLEANENGVFQDLFFFVELPRGHDGKQRHETIKRLIKVCYIIPAVMTMMTEMTGERGSGIFISPDTRTVHCHTLRRLTTTSIFPSFARTGPSSGFANSRLECFRLGMAIGSQRDPSRRFREGKKEGGQK